MAFAGLLNCDIAKVIGRFAASFAHSSMNEGEQDPRAYRNEVLKFAADKMPAATSNSTVPNTFSRGTQDRMGHTSRFHELSRHSVAAAVIADNE